MNFSLPPSSSFYTSTGYSTDRRSHLLGTITKDPRGLWCIPAKWDQIPGRNGHCSGTYQFALNQNGKVMLYSGDNPNFANPVLCKGRVRMHHGSVTSWQLTEESRTGSLVYPFPPEKRKR